MTRRGWEKKAFRASAGFVLIAAAAGGFFFHHVLAKAQKHDFTGRCGLCHTAQPEPGASFDTCFLKEDLEPVCLQCHSINQKTSHPVKRKPSSPMPLSGYLDREGRLSCVTCHEVHKEKNAPGEGPELKGFLRGHTRGRNFCLTCHNQEMLGASWNHRLVVSYAHGLARFEERSSGSVLDAFSAECLSCHDGVISRMNTVEVKSGSFRHGIGLSHPVGVEYPSTGRYDEFKPLGSLPAEVRLFDGKVGCLTCHNPYGGKKSFLVMDNKRSMLCLTCHIK